MWKTIYNKQPRLSRNRWMLRCKECSIKHRLRYFEAIVSSTVSFAAEHPPLYKKHFKKYDAQLRKFICRIVGPPPGTNWSAQWHNVFHEWNMRVDHCACASGISFWSHKCTIQYWNFASYITNLAAERWVRSALAWNPLPTCPSRGRPQQTWDTKFKCSASTKHWAIRKLLRKMHSDGML